MHLSQFWSWHGFVELFIGITYVRHLNDTDSCHPFGKVGIFSVGSEGVVPGMEKA